MSKDTEFVLVETVSMFRMRYMIEVPKGKSEYALDDVVMRDAELKEFSQKHLDEIIVSHRTIKPKRILELIDNDNEYCKSWSPEKKLEAFVNFMETKNEQTN
jgi:hypothetical protein